MNRLKDKVAIVTGGALGLGQAICLRMAQEGAKVAVTDILDKEAEEVVKKIIDDHKVAKFWHLNVAHENQIENVFKEINKKFGKIDILVNNAGISGINKPTHEISQEDWDRVITVNQKSVFLTVKHVIPYMRKNGGGSIINISSIYGLIGGADVPPYHAAKGAVRLMTKTDALLYAKDHIRVNSVHPGYIWTPMVENFARETGTGLAEFKKQVGNLHPLGHLGEPDDIAYGCIYLASDESKFVTGSELVIDGGYTAR